MTRRGDLLVCWPGELKLRTNGGPQSGLGPYVRTVKTKSGVTAVQVVYVRGGCSRSAVASLRTTCSGVCFFLVAMLMPGPLARNAGRKTRKRSGSRNAATKGGATVTPGWIYINPPDPEGRIRISAAVTGELPGQALSVVFAVRPDDEGPAARADPPSLGGKMPGQRFHIAV